MRGKVAKAIRKLIYDKYLNPNNRSYAKDKKGVKTATGLRKQYQDFKVAGNKIMKLIKGGKNGKHRM